MSKILLVACAIALSCASYISWGAPVKNTPPTVSLTSPTSGTSFVPGSNITLSASAIDSDGAITKVEFFQGKILLGTKTTEPYTITWSNVVAGSYSLTAKATDNGGAVTTSAAASISVSAPKIFVSSPTDGATVFGSSVTINGTFIGDETTSVWVDNGNSSRLATLDGNTFAATLPLFFGSNTINISVARRDKTSDSRTLTVVGAEYPKIAFKVPAISTFDAPANVTFEVDAISPSGTISRVDFLRDNAIQASVSAPPFLYTWNGVPAGSYRITAQAVDSAGYSSSASTNINVLAPNSLPAVSLTSPANNAVFQGPANITLTASASDSDGSVSAVDFYQNGALLGSTNAIPYSLTSANVAAGDYIYTATVTDDRGGTASSAPVNITVTPPNTPPSVSLTDPQDGSEYITADLTTPATINLAAIAADSDGSIDRVEFYQGATLLGTAFNPPYTYQWTSALPGNYALTARAVDNVGGATTSLAANITVKSNETITYLHNDFLGSAIAATDASGAVLWKENYQPYGERIRKESAASGNRQFYTGKPDDTDIGLSYFGARYYDPVVGRFMGIDPVRFDQRNIHSFNRYTYGNNNPYKFVDPDGKAAIPIVLFIPEIIAAGKAAIYVGSATAAAWYANQFLKKQENVSRSDSADATPPADAAPTPDITKRPSRVRRGTEQANWDNADDGKDGGKLCPTCGKEVHSKPGEKGKDWDNDHVPPWRERDLRGKDRKGVLDEYNQGTRIRCVNCNRSDNGAGNGN